MGIKNALVTSNKRIVSIENFRDKIRLRWRYNSKRYSLTYDENVITTSCSPKRLAQIIEKDIITGRFDTTLLRYHQSRRIPVKQIVAPILKLQLADHFGMWLKSMGMNIPTNNVNATHQMIKKWVDADFDNVADRLYNESLSPSTFNTRLNILKRFYKWIMNKGIISINPLVDLKSQKLKGKRKQRRPFDDEDIPRILEAFRTDEFSRSKTFPHSVYYPFIKFMFLTGVRNAECIGLKVKKINFHKKYIIIDESFSRCKNGATNVGSRVMKNTKQENSRYLPLTCELEALLAPICIDQLPDRFVFLNHKGNPIDDRMFQRRVFKPILKKLKIEERDLYATRHTFGTIAIEQGMSPLEAGYLMGHTNAKTILENYAHLRSVPARMPRIFLET